MEKGDKPKVSTFSTTKSGLKNKTAKPKKQKEKKPTKEKKPAKQKQKQKQKQENIQIVKVNVNQEKPSAPLMKPVRKEITKQTTYVTLDKPYALQPEEEELLTITKFIPNPPPFDPLMKSSAKVTTLVSNPKNEIPQANIQEQPLQIPVAIKKKVKAKKSSPLKQPKYDVPSALLTEIFEPKTRTLGKTTEEEQPLLSLAEEVKKVKKVKTPLKPVLSKAESKAESKVKTNSSTIDKSIQNSSINNNEKVQELVLAEPIKILTKIEKPDLQEEVYDYITNTDDANISNPNTGEKINIQNENELEEEFGLSSAQLSSYKEEYSMTPIGSVKGLVEEIERKSSRGRPVKYTSEEERIEAIKVQKKASALRKKEEAKAIKQTKVDIEYEKFIQGDYPPVSLEEMIEKDIIQMKQTEQAFAEAMVNEAYSISSGQDLSKLSSNELNAFFNPFVGQDIIVSPKIYLEESESSISKRKEKPTSLSSDFVSALVDKLSDNNNFGNIQSAQEPQFEFE